MLCYYYCRSSRPRTEQSLVRWASPQLNDIDALSKMVDPSLKGMYPAKSLTRFADIISQCVQVLHYICTFFALNICLIQSNAYAYLFLSMCILLFNLMHLDMCQNFNISENVNVNNLSYSIRYTCMYHSLTAYISFKPNIIFCKQFSSLFFLQILDFFLCICFSARSRVSSSHVRSRAISCSASSTCKCK